MWYLSNKKVRSLLYLSLTLWGLTPSLKSQSSIITGVPHANETAVHFFESLVWLENNQQEDALLKSFSKAWLLQQQLSEIKLERLSPHFALYLVKGIPENTNTNAVKATTALLAQLKRHPAVRLAQYNHVVQHRAIPNDPSYASQQWQYNNTGQGGGTVGADIRAQAAWDITTGGLTTAGDTIVVAVIDDGFQRTHTDLLPNMWQNHLEIPGNGIDDDGNGYVDDVFGWNAYNGNGTLTSAQHGTHVSGIIGARGNNNVGGTGVNWQVKIMPIMGSSGNEATVVAAYAYAAAMRRRYNQTNGQQGAFVVSTNSSFGVDNGNAANFPIWCAFYDTLGSVGILSAGAGPNNNVDVDAVGDVPTTCVSSFLIGVTNTTRNDGRNNSCGFGATSIDLGAPGTQIWNTVPTNNHSALTGTSMATPHVAGAIALYYSAACPYFIQLYKQNPAAMTLQMRQWVLNGVDPINALNGITTTGGRLNLLKGIQGVQSFNCNPNSPPSAAFIQNGNTGCPGLQIQFNQTSIGLIDSVRWNFPGGTPSTSTLLQPAVQYNQMGTFPVTLTVYNSFGADSITQNTAVNITNTATATIFTENFEGTSLSSMGWTSINPSGSAQWNLVNVNGNTPGNKAPGVNIFQNQSEVGQNDTLLSPLLDFSLFSNVSMRFEHAHRRRVSTVRDSLFVLVKSQQQPQPISLLRIAENGQGVFATNTLLNSNFVPNTANDWCFGTATAAPCLSAALQAFDGHTQVQLMFVVQNRGGNNIYIDNVVVEGVCSGFPVGPGPVAQFTSSGSVICEGDSLLFSSTSTGTITQTLWQLSGATPPQATGNMVWGTWNTAGLYPVQLWVSDGLLADSVIQMITVESPLPTPIIQLSNGVLSAPSAFSYQWFTTQGDLPGETAQQFIPPGPGLYGVKVFTEGGCTTSSALFNFVLSLDPASTIRVMIYPNPTRDMVHIMSDELPQSIRVFDAQGRLWREAKETQHIRVAGLAAGVYWLQLHWKEEHMVLPLVVQP